MATTARKRITRSNHMKPIRQGDVLLAPVGALPVGCAEIQPTADNKIVLALGEATGHHHRIEGVVIGPAAAAEIAEAAISRAKARLWQSAAGDRYLQVLEPVSLRHEEHSAHQIPPGIYELPVQMEYSVATMRRVAD
ncbi:MAG: hypothetical protein J0H00_19690 [Burkholderiales bacterium]|nr:hypothetical protein [Burkholderiales bacterium]